MAKMGTPKSRDQKNGAQKRCAKNGAQKTARQKWHTKTARKKRPTKNGAPKMAHRKHRAKNRTPNRTLQKWPTKNGAPKMAHEIEGLLMGHITKNLASPKKKTIYETCSHAF